MSNFSYEDKYDIIDTELRKRRSKWLLSSVQWIDFDDVCQIIHAHIHVKWEQWDQQRPLKPWVNRVISNQIKNILRNVYFNFARPCTGCPFNEGNPDQGADDSIASKTGFCSFTTSGRQCSECPLYSKWEKQKKPAFNIKMPVALENHENSYSLSSKKENFDLEHSINKLQDILKLKLKPKDYEIFTLLFIKGYTDEEVAKKLNLKSNEKGRKAGYKQIKNLKKRLKERVISIIQKEDLF